MNFSISLYKNGKRGKIYTIQFEDQSTEYYRFVDDYIDDFQEEINEIETRLESMVKTHGLQEYFFKRESPESHNVFRIKNTGEELRIFCIRYSNVAIILGNGGLKLPETIKLSDNPSLEEIRDQLMNIEDMINSRIRSKDIEISDDGITGDLNFNL